MPLHQLFSSASAELVALVRNQTRSNLEAFFQARMIAWPYPLIEMDAFEDLRGSLKSSDAFNLMPAAFELVLGQEDPLMRELAGALAITLARTSETTKMPIEAERLWSVLEEYIDALPPAPPPFGSCLADLKRWYRGDV